MQPAKHAAAARVHPVEDILHAYALEQVVTVNTAASGGNAALLSEEEKRSRSCEECAAFGRVTWQVRLFSAGICSAGRLLIRHPQKGERS